MSGVSEGETHVAAMRLVCQSLEEHEQQGIEIQWDVLQQQLDQMDVILQGIADQRSDDAEEIETLRKQLSADAVRQELESLKAKNAELLAKLATVENAAAIENETLRGAMAADDKRLRDAEERVWPGETRGCDAPDAMADEILHLRQQLFNARVATIIAQAQLDAARAETVEARRRLDDETDRHRATNAEKIDLFQKLEWANQHAAELIKERDAALAAVDLQRAGINRLNAFVEKARQANRDESWLGIGRALNYLDEETTEPATETEPARCPECERWQRAKRIDSELVASKAKEIERLRAFVGRVRELLRIPLAKITYDDMAIMRAELAALDAGTEPAPATEADEDDIIDRVDGDALAAGITEVVREIVEGRKAKAVVQLNAGTSKPEGGQ